MSRTAVAVLVASMALIVPVGASADAGSLHHGPGPRLRGVQAQRLADAHAHRPTVQHLG
jgi:hypothetical protein